MKVDTGDICNTETTSPTTATTAGGKIYPKCLPKHALKSLTTETEAHVNISGDDENGNGITSEISVPVLGGLTRDKKLLDTDTRRKKSAAAGGSRFSNGSIAAEVGTAVEDDDITGHEDIPFSENGKKIVFSKIEDIPTRPDSPKETPPPVWPPLPPSTPPGHVTEVSSRKKFERNTFVAAVASETRRKGDTNHNAAGGGGGGGTTRLKFGLNLPSSKRLLQGSGGSSTFAELSNKLGPLGHRKNGLKQLQQQQELKASAAAAAGTTFASATEMTSSSSGRLPPLKEHIRQIEAAVAAEVASTAAAASAAVGVGGGVIVANNNNNNNNNNGGTEEADAATDVVDMELEESFVESTSNRRQLTVDPAATTKQTSKSRSRDSRSRSPSRSRSWSRSRRSRSRSYKSYSRSRSRGSFFSGRSSSSSRSRSYSSSSSASSYSSKSRSRSRSPSIQRRRGSPSFLDKRRITR